MRSRNAVAAALLSIAFTFGNPGVLAQPAGAQGCPPNPLLVVDIRGSDSRWRELLSKAVQCDHTHVRLGPDVDMSFDGLQSGAKLQFGKCVWLTSVSAFERPSPTGTTPPAFECTTREAGTPSDTVILGPGGPEHPEAAAPNEEASAEIRAATSTPSVSGPISGPLGEIVGNIGPLEAELVHSVGSARTPRSLGPILRFGRNHGEEKVFLSIPCFPDAGGPGKHEYQDGVRISGFRLEGPSQGQQTAGDIGIQIDKCIDIEISNMEISGWGAAAIQILDGKKEDVQSSNADGGRLVRFDQIKIFNNYIHNNQHPTSGGEAAGYGVSVGAGAWAQIAANVFDNNRHALEASGYSGGYLAERNLVLKGGGFHDGFFSEWTHQFDVHGTHNCKARDVGWGTLFLMVGLGAILLLAGVGAGLVLLIAGGGSILIGGAVYLLLGDGLWNCGYAGFDIQYRNNAFQYLNDNAIKLRGVPRVHAQFSGNVFAHNANKNFEVGGITGCDTAICLQTGDNIEIFDDNTYGVDTFGEYGICDFDGDGVDDLFLATGATWWYSSSGKFHWSYLNAKRQRLEKLKFGYFDDDNRCDVITEADGKWLYVSGGFGDWIVLGAQRDNMNFGTPISEVAFGHFDPRVLSPGGRPRRTTHAFRRRADTQWEVTGLDAPNWSATAADGRSFSSSGTVFEDLQFGDFTGDGVTDVLGVVGGKWRLSKSALEPWSAPPWNPHIGVDVTQKNKLFVVNMDADDNQDDVLLFDSGRKVWRRSRNGQSDWEEFTKYQFGPAKVFAGRFGATGNGGVLAVDSKRYGFMYSPAERGDCIGSEEVGCPSVEWRSAFQY
jgi:hypothetical protein